MQQGHEQSFLQLVRGEHVDERDGQLREMLRIGARHAYVAGLRLQHHIVRRAVRLIGKALDVAVYERGVQALQPRAIEPELLGIRCKVVADQHIGLAQQFIEALAITSVL